MSAVRAASMALVALAACGGPTDARTPEEVGSSGPPPSTSASVDAAPSASPAAADPERDARAFIVANEAAVNRILAARLEEGLEGASRAFAAERDVLYTKWRAIADLTGAALSEGMMLTLKASVTDGAKDVCMLGDQKLCKDYVGLFE